ncbi:hypothetical protein M2132_000472 [Dysgonomonas sp. PH5-45]|uniref:DUF4836 family protein n=1 Tax=unclassified Dysgonomonas TaxID=2630389 RepID=UPI0024741F2A|nr:MULTISPECIES: DUF4836 family protein [unclassified Dysgonomonas]MDH6354150.1 hypothetical protein [Dysgonomonas sp. PH5-45]MDH6386999.1 hypothetical protein [Dysgonomonas sp. PH5-37]
MRKIISIVSLLVLIFTSCSKENKELLNTIPADASFVVRFNCASLAEKAGLNKEETDKLLKEIGDNNEQSAAFAKIAGDPSSCGLDFEENSFVFGNKNFQALLMAVSDADKLHETIKTMFPEEKDKITKSNGVYVASENSNVALVWDNSRLLIYNASSSGSDIAPGDAAKALLKQDEKASLAGDELFKAFLDKKSDLSIFVSPDAMNDFKDLADIAGVAMNMPIVNMVADARNSMYIDFNKGEIVAKSAMSFLNKEAENHQKELMESLTGKGSDNHFKYLNENPAMFISANLKGEGLVKMLEQQGIMKELGKESLFDIASLLGNIDGDLTCTLNNIGGGDFEINLFADIKDPAVMQTAIKEMATQFMLPVQKVDDNNYYIFTGAKNIYLGTKDKLFYLTTQKEVLNSDYKSGFKKSDLPGINDGVFYFYVNTASIFGSTYALGGFGAMTKDFSISVTDYKSTEMKLRMADANKNSLAVIFEQIRK